jgi:hypothetical protein
MTLPAMAFSHIVVCPIDIESLQKTLLKVRYVLAASAGLNKILFLLQPLTVLMKQTRQVVHAFKQSIYVDVYGMPPFGAAETS